MITGEVSAYREAVITIPVYNADGKAVSVDTVLDMGFSEYLTLPSAVIATLGQVRSDITRLLLANGLREWFRVYEAVVPWTTRSE